MRRAFGSFRHSLHGLTHAMRHERNLHLFLILHCIVCGTFLVIGQGTAIIFLIFLSMPAALFFIVELLNTALERLADTFDDYEKKHRGGHYHPGIKMTKDVAAAGSLIALCLYSGCVIVAAYGLYTALTFD